MKQKKTKNNYKISENQNIMIGIFGIVFSFIFLIIALFFQLQNQNFKFAIFLVISFWLFSLSLTINITKQTLKSFVYVTIVFVLFVLPFTVSVPFVLSSADHILIMTICIDFVVGLVFDLIFVYLVLLFPKNKKMKFLVCNENIIKQSNEIQTTYEAIFFNEKGDRALIIKVNTQKYIVRIEKLVENKYYFGILEASYKNILDAKVSCYKELLFLNQECRNNLPLNIEMPKSEKLKKLMLFFNKSLLKDDINEAFLASSFFSTYYNKEYIYLVNRKDKMQSIEIHQEDENLYFCLLGVREILPVNVGKEDIYDIIKMVLQGKLIYILNKRKTILYSKPIYDVYDLRKLNNLPIFLKLKILLSKNSKTWTGISANEYLKNQKKMQKSIYDVDFYCDALNKKLESEKISETFIVKKKLLKGKIRKCLHVSNKTNVIKQADIYISKNQIKYKFVFAFVSAPLLLDFEDNVQTMLDFTSQMFLDKVVFHYKTTSDGKMYEKGMFLLDKNNEFKTSILSYLQNNSNIEFMVWSELDSHTILARIYEIFKI